MLVVAAAPCTVPAALEGQGCEIAAANFLSRGWPQASCALRSLRRTSGLRGDQEVYNNHHSYANKTQETGRRARVRRAAQLLAGGYSNNCSKTMLPLLVQDPSARPGARPETGQPAARALSHSAGGAAVPKLAAYRHTAHLQHQLAEEGAVGASVG